MSNPTTSTPAISSHEYGCPFRRLDPFRFNVQDYEYCALRSFKNITAVKIHVLKYHQQADFTVECSNCYCRFKNQEHLEAHFPNCFHGQVGINPRVTDGVDSYTDELLRAKGEKSKVMTWEALCNTLFPTIPFIPARFYVYVREMHL